MKRKVLITKKLPSIAKELLSEKFEVYENLSEELSSTDKISAVREYDAILSTIPDVFNKDILSHSQKLMVISNYAVGLDNIDVSYANEKNIAVYNLPDVVTNSTAELGFALLLSLIKKICPASKFVREDKWKKIQLDIFVGEELFGKTFGIIGFGRIGRAAAKIAAGFGMRVIFYHRRQIQLDGINASQVSLDKLLNDSNYISIHLPLTKETHNFIDIAKFEKMKKKPVLVNMARGGVVNTQDLVKALEKGYVSGAALDVVDPEPISGKHKLCSLSNCIIVPHIGTATKECREQMAKMAALNIINHFEY
jgi:glyoxylate reductase